MVRSRPHRISVNTPCWLLGHPASPLRRLPSTWTYTTANPFAVQVTFHVTSGPVTWLFAREMLDDGCHATSGIADVQITPFTHEEVGEVVRIQLTSPSVRAVLLANRAPIREFLTRTYEIAAAGTEAKLLPIDKWLSSLLSA